MPDVFVSTGRRDVQVLFVLDLARGECEHSVCTWQYWTGRWLLSLTDRVAETLAALCSLPNAHMRMQRQAASGLLRIEAFHSLAVMCAVWLSTLRQWVRFQDRRV